MIPVCRRSGPCPAFIFTTDHTWSVYPGRAGRAWHSRLRGLTRNGEHEPSVREPCPASHSKLALSSHGTPRSSTCPEVRAVARRNLIMPQVTSLHAGVSESPDAGTAARWSIGPARLSGRNNDSSVIAHPACGARQRASVSQQGGYVADANRGPSFARCLIAITAAVDLDSVATKERAVAADERS